MAISEKIQQAINTVKRQLGNRAHVETDRSDRKINFFNLLDPKAAEERNVPPGYYFTIHPVMPEETETTEILHKSTLQFFEQLQEVGLLQKSNSSISIDNGRSMVIDPAMSWKFSQFGYISELGLLVVQAEQVSQDEAQPLFVKAISGKK